MGIYPQTTWTTSSDQTVTRTVTEPGVERVTVYEPIMVIVKRDDCYCCSCDDDFPSMHDPYCRNHGFMGKRRCDVHEMPGDEFDDNGAPLASVQEHRRSYYG
jgi:hypothetical protein